MKGKMKAAVTSLVLCVLCLACNDAITQAPIQMEGSITAGLRMASIDSLAKLHGRKLVLMGVKSGEMSPAGTSAIWYYWYVEFGPPLTGYLFHATFNSVAFEGTIPDGTGMDITNIYHAWLDSDQALALAENNGGREFRSHDPGCTIDAYLYEYALTTNPQPYWAVSYHPGKPNASGFGVRVNALTGVVSK
jgi:hypothetical protein